jgi:cob(I)alamin adenosyltransferase
MWNLPVKNMKIYTKKGDQGKTALCDGRTVSKSSLRVKAYGDLDELNSWIGFVISESQSKKINAILSSVQKDLFILGSHTATCSPETKMALPKFGAEKLEHLEKIIDEISDKLEPIDRFILPAGTRSASSLHIARTVCRRAERTCVLLSENEKLFEKVIPYLNRLSDLLFVLARYANKGKDVFV